MLAKQAKLEHPHLPRRLARDKSTTALFKVAQEGFGDSEFVPNLTCCAEWHLSVFEAQTQPLR